MAPDRPLRWVALFLAVAILVPAGLTAVTHVTPSQPGAPAEGYPDAAGITVPRADATGSLDLDPRDSSGIVLVDDAHENRFGNELSVTLERAITEAGYEVRYLEDRGNLRARLSEASAFVVVDPAAPYDADEASAVARFAARGGRVALFGEPNRKRLVFGVVGSQVIRAQTRINSLSAKLGVDFGTEYLYNLQRNEGNFKRVFASPTGAIGGFDRVAFHTATVVQAPNGTRLLETIPGTQLSGANVSGRLPVAVRRGNVMAVGDTEFLRSGRVFIADNEHLVEHVGRFLTGGDREPGVASYPAFVGPEPAVAYTNTTLLNPAQAVTRDLRAAGAAPSVQFRGVRSDRPDVLVTTYDYLASRDLGTRFSVAANFATVAGHTVAREKVAAVRAGGPRYDLVIAARDADAAAEAVDVLRAGNLTAYAVSEEVALIRTRPP